MKVSAHFELREFIDPVTYKELGDKSIEKIDKRLIDIAELLRTLTGKPVTINNWFNGGQYKESGLRRMDSPTGAKRSAHKEGKAIDCKVSGMTVAAVHALVMAHEKEFYDAGVRQMEDISFTPTWTHLGTREGSVVNVGKIQVIKP
jgi:hypothetical protein